MVSHVTVSEATVSNVMVPGDGGPRDMMSHVKVCGGVGVAKVSHVSNVYGPTAVVFVPGCRFQYSVCAYMRGYAITSRIWSRRHAKNGTQVLQHCRVIYYQHCTAHASS